MLATSSGRLRGVRQGAVDVFKGVPYAAAPVGARRFRAPSPVIPWDGIRDASAYGAQCIQTNDDQPGWLDPSRQSEDCLFLNIWCPNRASDRPRPVMVWLHGGAYSVGSGGVAIYDGAALAARGDVVVVTLNHRLNLWGYIWLGDLIPELAEDGNAGQRDVVQALRWLRDNIAAFGGDPGNITLFGESGGGGKVSALLATPAAKGLFHKAIIQSGSRKNFPGRSQASAIADQVLHASGVTRPDLATLQRLPTDRLRKTDQLVQGLLSWSAFQPVIDGRSMPQSAWLDTAPAESVDVPLLIGTNSQEMAYFLPDMDLPVADDAAFLRRLDQGLRPTRMSNDEIAALLKAYEELTPDMTRLDRLVAFTTDLWWRAHAINQAELKVRQGGAPVYLYNCDWRTPSYGGSWAGHSVIVPFTFGNLTFGSIWNGKDNDAERAAADPHGDRFRLAAQIMDAWAAFAHAGDPSTPMLSWPRYDMATRATMMLDHRSRVVPDAFGERRKLIAAVSGAVPGV